MKNSQDHIIKAVMLIGEKLDIEKEVKLLLINTGLHSTIKEVIYRLFINNYNSYFEQNDAMYDAYELIRRYCKEITENGEVKFNEKQ